MASSRRSAQVPRTALLLANGDELPYRVMRCLADAGLAVHVLGTRESSVARLRRSGHCRSIDLLPLADLVSGDAVEAVNAAARAHGADLVVAADPATTRFLAWHGERLEQPHFPVLPGALFERLVNKDSFADLCAEFDLPHPRTVVCPDAAAALRYADSRGPGCKLVAKPVDGFASIGVWILDPGVAADRQRLANVGYAPILLQDFLDGTDVNVLLLCDDGAIVTSVSYEIHGEHYAVVDDPALQAHLRRLAATLRLNGPVGFDLRREADGRYWLLECNPRFTFDGSLVCLLAGINPAKAFLAPGSVPGQAVATRLRRAKLLRPWTLAASDRRHASYLVDDLLYNASLALQQFTRTKLNRGRF